MHRQAAGRPSYNLDTYLVPAERVRDTFCRVAQNADIAIIEGVMGLFDGSSPTSRVGSTAEVAALLQAPIVLVIDASGMAASVGALIRGFRTYDPDVRVAGVILNRLGSAGHARYLEPAIAREGVEILGYLPKDAELTIPERHLGLLPTSEEDRVTAPGALNGPGNPSFPSRSDHASGPDGLCIASPAPRCRECRTTPCVSPGRKTPPSIFGIRKTSMP